MIFIQFEAMPSQRVLERDNVAGAYVNCWVNIDDASDAETSARRWIAEQDWVVASVVECRTIDLDVDEAPRVVVAATDSPAEAGHYVHRKGRLKAAPRTIVRLKPDTTSDGPL